MDPAHVQSHINLPPPPRPPPLLSVFLSFLLFLFAYLCSGERDTRGIPSNHREWWVNKYDYPADDSSKLEENHKESHGHGHDSHEEVTRLFACAKRMNHCMRFFGE